MKYKKLLYYIVYYFIILLVFLNFDGGVGVGYFFIYIKIIYCGMIIFFNVKINVFMVF